MLPDRVALIKQTSKFASQKPFRRIELFLVKRLPKAARLTETPGFRDSGRKDHQVEKS